MQKKTREKGMSCVEDDMCITGVNIEVKSDRDEWKKKK